MPWSPPKCWPDCSVWRGRKGCARCRISRRCRPAGLAAAGPSRRPCRCRPESPGLPIEVSPMRALLAVGMALLGAGSLEAQQALPEPAIEDNSFLIEEAYNQEP